MFDLSGKTILVTGGSRGIGAAIVKVLAAAGAEVVLHYGRSQAEAERVAREAGNCYLVGADLAQRGVARLLWEEALAWKGKIDVLVNNAGIAPYAGVEDEFEQWSRVWNETLQVNLLSLADLCREAILHYRSRGGGILINIASRAAFRGDNPDMMHYAASKGGVVALTKSIARGFGKEGILAYGVAPGWVETEMAADYIREHAADIARDIPIGSVAPPQDVANTVAFLAAGLAPHMTGATLDINGASYVR
ncbi:MAG TPA: SDR family NAD(P)-dependent oxidoreductase [Meiothermus sp.]|nr:SDR family NAD(P)-dependent oxidoreductase [Meiothermus sp.]